MTESSIDKPAVPKTRLFWVGVALMPYIFAWFTLSKKHGVISRVVAFGWMIVVVSILMSDKDIVNRVQNTSGASNRQVTQTGGHSAVSKSAELCKRFVATIPNSYLHAQSSDEPCGDLGDGVSSVRLTHPNLWVHFGAPGFMWFASAGNPEVRPWLSPSWKPEDYQFPDIYFKALEAAGFTELPELKFTLTVIMEGLNDEKKGIGNGPITEWTRCASNYRVTMVINRGASQFGEERLESVLFERTSRTLAHGTSGAACAIGE